MTSLMTAEDAVSLGTVLEENHDTYKGYIEDHIRQLDTQVRSDCFYFLTLFQRLHESDGTFILPRFSPCCKSSPLCTMFDWYLKQGIPFPFLILYPFQRPDSPFHGIFVPPLHPPLLRCHPTVLSTQIEVLSLCFTPEDLTL